MAGCSTTAASCSEALNSTATPTEDHANQLTLESSRTIAHDCHHERKGRLCLLGMTGVLSSADWTQTVLTEPYRVSERIEVSGLTAPFALGDELCLAQVHALARMASRWKGCAVVLALESWRAQYSAKTGVDLERFQLLTTARWR